MNDLMGRHFYTNIDINSVVTPFLNRAAEIDAADPAVLYPFVDAYAGTQITDILFESKEEAAAEAPAEEAESEVALG